jgi:uncharacterized membrane protein YvbJ
VGIDGENVALISCGECGSQISDKSVACVKCGAPVADLHVLKRETSLDEKSITSPPPDLQKKSKLWLWVAIPVATFAAVVLYGMSIPSHIAEANAFARTCKKNFVAQGLTSIYDCDRVESQIRNKQPR